MSDNAPPQFVLLGPGDYDRAKSILNKARHPGFVGRELFYRCATTGQCIVAVVDDQDLGVALIAKGKLQALSVVKDAQGKGVGGALMRHCRPQWANVIADRVSWFEKLGYKAVGAMKIGASGAMATQLMQLGEMPESTAAASAPKSTPKTVNTRALDSDDGALDAIARLRVARMVLDSAMSAKVEAEEAIAQAQAEIAELEGELFGKRAKATLNGGITFAPRT